VEPLTPHTGIMLVLAVIGIAALFLGIIALLVYAAALWDHARTERRVNRRPKPATPDEMERLRAIARERVDVARAQYRLSADERRRLNERLDADKAGKEQDRVANQRGFRTI
jgi:Flp pilus assembly protein TadB